MSVSEVGPGSMTRDGYERLRAELDELVTVRQPEDRVERRISELRRLLAEARIVEPALDGTIGVGAFVRLRTAGSGKTAEYQLVGAAESDPSRRRVSITSPVGEALVGHAAGDVVHVDAPGGPRSFEVIAVDYGEERAAA